MTVSQHSSFGERGTRDKAGSQVRVISLSGIGLRSKKAALLEEKKMSRWESDLTLCSPRQSSKTVSWRTLNSLEFNSRWIPKRSLCITRYERRGWGQGGRTVHTFFFSPTVWFNSLSTGHLPLQWGRKARRTAASPGSGSAWWSGSAGTASGTVKTSSPTDVAPAGSHRKTMRGSH